MTPCLAAVYAAALAVPTKPATDAVLTMVPRPRGTITANSCFMHSHTPRRSTPTICSQRSLPVASKDVIEKSENAGVVECGVDAAVDRFCNLHHGLDFRLNRDVCVDKRCPASGAGDRRHRPVASFVVDVGDHHRRALSSEQFCRRAADS